MTELTIINRNGVHFIDSRQVAMCVGKKHNQLLRNIAGYLKALEKYSLPTVEGSDFFVRSAYTDAKCEVRPCYLLTKMGCELVTVKLSGKKVVLFAAAYIRCFDEAEAVQRSAEIKAMSKTNFSALSTAARSVPNEMDYCHLCPERIMNIIHGTNETPKPPTVSCQPKTEKTYLTATEIADILGIYSESGRPHGHAVSAIIMRLGIPCSDVTILPYGMVGVMVKYKDTVLGRVRNWIISHDYPQDIPHLHFEYHIYYQQPQYNQSSMSGGNSQNYADDKTTFTSDELDMMCENNKNCEDCPGLEACVEEYLNSAEFDKSDFSFEDLK